MIARRTIARRTGFAEAAAQRLQGVRVFGCSVRVPAPRQAIPAGKTSGQPAEHGLDAVAAFLSVLAVSVPAIRLSTRDAGPLS